MAYLGTCVDACVGSAAWVDFVSDCFFQFGLDGINIILDLESVIVCAQIFCSKFNDSHVIL